MKLQLSVPPAAGRDRLMTLAALFALSAMTMAGQDGPANHRVLLATSTNGLDWVVQRETLAEHASVPELFLNPEGRPTILFVDANQIPERLSAMERDAAGAWRRVETNLREVDPNVVRLNDGSYRAYVKAGLDGAMAAFASDDGLNWRALGEVFRDARYPNATDPDVFETPSGWVMLVSLGARLLRCTSADGLRFTTDGTVIDLGGSVSDTVKVEGGWRTYFHVNPDGRSGSLMHIRSAFTADGLTWQVEEGVRVAPPPEGPAALGVGDPAVAQVGEGAWLMAIKSFIGPPAMGPVYPVQTNGMNGHWVGSATSADGLTWTRDEGVRLAPGSVPAVIPDRDERVLMYFVKPPNEPGKPETVACAVSTDGMKFELVPSFAIEGLSTLKAVDPSIVKDEDGRYRLYYLGSNHPGDPAAGPNPHAIHMAVSEDGVRFREMGPVFRYPDLVDPDVFRYGDQWWMYVAARDATVIARSADGKEFTYVGPMSPPGWGTTAPVLLADGRLRLYAFDQRTPVGNVVRSFVSSDGLNWTAEPGDRLKGNSGEQITDPFVIPWRGGYKMYFKSNASLPRFVTGQNADLVLGAKGLNDSGGGLLFNHPTGLATDGKALLVADRWNNRVLIWKEAPSSNVTPDIVLGQQDFQANNSGPGLHQFNWPGNVAIGPDGRRLAVADTNNNRVLIWNEFPRRNGAPADLVLDLTRMPQPAPGPGVIFNGWPWGVWTDGTKLAVVATQGGAVLIWNAFPVRNNQPPDFVLRPRGVGTPRNITSDGASFFALSDHNNGEASTPGTMVWNLFPSSADEQPAFTIPEWLKGTLTPDGRLVMAGSQSIYIWNGKPADAQARANVVLRPPSYRNGDGPDAVIVGGRLYVANYNGNNILGWNRVPERADVLPDFSIGSDKPEQDTWAENYFIQNPVLATDGKSLFASSDFDRKLFVWRALPTESAVMPDAVVNLQEAMWDNALFGDRLALAGKRTVYLWNSLPLSGEKPDITFTGRIGEVELRELTGVAMDGRHLYLADRQANRIYVWEGIPTPASQPKAALEMQNPGHLSSDGAYLVAAPFEGQEVLVWPVDSIGADNKVYRLGGPGVFNLPAEALIAGGRFFVADRSNNRVQVWNRVQDALEGKPADVFLGALDSNDRSAGVTRNKLFMPGSLAYDGANLWVGEFKFSTRILRFSVR